LRREYIKWTDSGYSIRSDVWQTPDEIKNLVEHNKEVETIGYNIYEDSDWICLVQSVHYDEFDGEVARGGYLIYKKCIIERKLI